MEIPFYNLAGQHREIAASLSDAFTRVLQSGHYILDKELEAFEQEFASYVGTKHCIGVGNGLDALVLILRALKIGPGDEVIVPTHTFIATWLAVSHVGATLIPCHTDAYFMLDPNELDQLISDKTKAIIAVHLYGHCADMDAIKNKIAFQKIHLIEDAAQAHGAAYKDRKAGNLSIAAGFSFYPGKNLGALGDGGSITTSDDILADQIRTLRNYGSKKKYKHEMIGTNSRLDELQAALLRVKLQYLDEWNKKRQHIAEIYRDNLKDCPQVILPRTASWCNPVWHQYVIRCHRRNELQSYLKKAGIDTLIHYPIANHLQAAYLGYFSKDKYLYYQKMTNEILSLPMDISLEKNKIEYICEVIKSF